jgi:homoserine dehydrogenase
VPESPVEPVRVALLGCGNVGAALVDLLAEPGSASHLARRSGISFEVVGIAVGDPSKPRSEEPWFPGDRIMGDAASLVARDDVDVVVELIGGIEPAGSLIEAALRSGKPVVSANKALLAERGAYLSSLAASLGLDLNFEAAVAGAIPVIRTLRESLAGEEIARVMGIVNGTTNYILSKMAGEGRDYADVLSEAQSLGLAERDPSADVEGFDAAAKAAILAGLAFGCEVPPGSVHREGITSVRAIDVAFARRLGYAVKLLAVAERLDDEEISVRVHPTMVPVEHPLAQVEGAFNAVFIEGAALGSLMLYGQGAGGAPTASAVLGDLIDAARHLRGAGATPAPVRDLPATVTPIGRLRSAFYLSLDVYDRPGVLAAVASVFGEHHVSIRSMEQQGFAGEARLVFVTHQANEADMAATIEELSKLEAVEAVGGVLRVIEVATEEDQ